MADYKLKHSGEEIDALLDKAKSAVQYDKEDNKIYITVDGLIDSDDIHYYLPEAAPANDKKHTFAMLSDIDGAYIPLQRQFSDDFNDDYAR